MQMYWLKNPNKRRKARNAASSRYIFFYYQMPNEPLMCIKNLVLNNNRPSALYIFNFTEIYTENLT